MFACRPSSSLLFAGSQVDVQHIVPECGGALRSSHSQCKAVDQSQPQCALRRARIALSSEVDLAPRPHSTVVHKMHKWDASSAPRARACRSEALCGHSVVRGVLIAQ